jgi:hypothetical protein
MYLDRHYRLRERNHFIILEHFSWPLTLFVSELDIFCHLAEGRPRSS